MGKLHTLPIVALQVLEELRNHLARAIERTNTPEDVKETLTDIRARIVGLIDHAGEAAQELEHEGEE
jgi:hypothetical protein